MRADSCLYATLFELSRAPCYAERMTCITNTCISLGVDQRPERLPMRRRRAPLAAAERLGLMKVAAVLTPALRHAAAQHRRALDVRSAQAGLRVSLCDQLRSAALHAARVGSVACYVPLLKHGHVGVAVWRHAICQCKVSRSAPGAMLPWMSSGSGQRPVWC